ncbi:MAG: T9SS type A sorting domain-containing protein, partial [Bacteroidales bacterium]|nr:T9SS type A sorting domain-containing protein [Bacteroidales bacterium]
IIDLSWKPSMVEGLQTYIIYRNGERYATTKQSTFHDADIVDGTSYTYWVTAYYEGEYTGESEKSNVITFTPKGIMTLPYSENFEAADHGWKIKGSVEGFRWGDASELGMETLNSTKFLGANSIAAGEGTVCSDYAITPRLNLANKTQVFVHFDYSLKRWQQLDHLKIFWRRSASESWIQIIDMPTSGVGVGFRWRKYNLELPTDCYTEQMQLGFQYDDGNDLGYGAAIDNVVIDENAISGIIDENKASFEVNLYPNPAGDQTTLQIKGAAGGQVALKLLSIDGKTIWSEIRKNQTDGQATINLKGVTNGIYYLVVETADEVVVKSLVKQN